VPPARSSVHPRGKGGGKVELRRGASWRLLFPFLGPELKENGKRSRTSLLSRFQNRFQEKGKKGKKKTSASASRGSIEAVSQFRFSFRAIRSFRLFERKRRKKGGEGGRRCWRIARCPLSVLRSSAPLDRKKGRRGHRETTAPQIPLSRPAASQPPSKRKREKKERGGESPRSTGSASLFSTCHFFCLYSPISSPTGKKGRGKERTARTSYSAGLRLLQSAYLGLGA